MRIELGRWICRLTLAWVCGAWTGLALAQALPALAPSGTLRAAINLGNPILAQRNASTGAVEGVSVDIAQALAQRLHLPLTLVVVDSAGQSVAAVNAGRADVGFFAVDPVRAQGLSFTAPYVLIEGSYLVRQDSALQRNEEVDVPGRRIVVGQASAYDLFLSREIHHATLVRAPTSPSVVDMMLANNHEVAAGVKQQLQADAKRLGGLRLLPGRFMVIEQALGFSAQRSPEVAAYLRAFMDELRQGDFIENSLARHHIEGASVSKAPPTSHASEITLLSAGAAKAALDDIIIAYQRATGLVVKADFAPVGTIVKRLSQGEQADVLIVTTDVMPEVQAHGWAPPGAARPVGRVGIGVAIQNGRPVPDISSEAAMIETLRQAKSITYMSPDKGTSGKHFALMLERMGIAQEMQAKTTLGDAGFVVEPVAKGEIELGIQQITEILPVQGAQLVGPLPASLQKITTYAVTPGANAHRVEAAQSFIQFLGTPQAQAIFAQRGFMPVAPSP